MCLLASDATAARKSSVPGHLAGCVARYRSRPSTSPSTRPGSTTWKHSPSPQMSHQKRHSLSEGRVRDTGT